MLRRGEDVGVRQGCFIGFTASWAEKAAGQTANKGSIRVSPHPDLETEDKLLQIARNVMDEQAHEL